ncbi:MAG TPA: transposase, partial [Mycobacterium sp.]|nr:transposase [Mycobacterium sp.]
MDKQGRRRVYESVYLRRTYREGDKVRHQTLANLSVLPEAAITAIEATLKGQTLVAAGSEFRLARSLRHGDGAAVAVMAHKLGLPALLGPACRSRDLVLALIISRVIDPACKLATLAAWPDTTVGVDLGVA